ncbi:MAG: DinB family protein [Chloroflexi bacterium]|nr:DinB family protein [Chloroflexota bacterium]MCI0644100.1 DinB family protein [Chloroflexota bacterium]
MNLEEQLLDTWRIHCRINLYILEAIPAEAFATPKPAKGRHFADMLAHIHNTRLMWLESGAKTLLAGLAKIDKAQATNPALLRDGLAASGQAIETMIQQVLASGSRVKGFKPHAPAFVGYLIAHEAYHHGEIGLALAAAGFPLDQKTAYGMWEWGVR